MTTTIPNTTSEAEVLDRARGFAQQYRVILTPNAGGTFIANAMELPGIIIESGTVQGAVADLQSVLTETIAAMLRSGRVPPQPAAGRRTEQVNVKLSLEERTLLESAARAKGNRGIADYLRQMALNSIGRGS